VATTHGRRSSERWLAYYRGTAKRPPRDLLLEVLDRFEPKPARQRTAIDLGFGSGTDTLELLRRGWQVLAIDRQDVAARFLQRRVPPRWRSRLTIVVAAMEEVPLPPADLVYASFSLPFSGPEGFPGLWSNIRSAVRQGGRFAGQLFGDRDAWRKERELSFHSRSQVTRLTRGWKVELLRETDEDGRSFSGPKQWHFFELILRKPPS
jgi:tellurite methyltransferase